MSIEHKEPIVTEISIIQLKKDREKTRPYVHLPGIKSTNSVSLITRSRLQRNWQLVNNVLPQVPETRGTNITSEICEGKRGLPVTAKMANPGAKRKQIKPVSWLSWTESITKENSFLGTTWRQQHTKELTKI